MSVWGFVQSVTRNLDEAAGLQPAARSVVDADPSSIRASRDMDRDELQTVPYETTDYNDDDAINQQSHHFVDPLPGSREIDAVDDADGDANRSNARAVSPEQNKPPTASHSDEVVATVASPTATSAASTGVAAACDAAHIAALSGQTERLSKALAKAEVDNARLVEELRQATAGRQSGSAREEQLMEEGRQLAAEVGKERERSKALLLDKRQQESKIAQLQQQIDQGLLREQQAAEAKQLLVVERDRLKDKVHEVQGETKRHATDTESTLRELEELRYRIHAMREEHINAVNALRRSSEESLASKERDVEIARSEIETLRFEIQSAVVQCEKRVAASERDLVAVTSRALAAEARCLELTQQAAEAGADVRHDSERLLAQLAAAQAARRQSDARVVMLEKDLGELRTVLRDVEASMNHRLAQQHEDIISLRKELIGAQRSVEREKGRSNALAARNEELTEEANRLLASLQAESARATRLASVTPVASSVRSGTSSITASTPSATTAAPMKTEDDVLVFIERLLQPSSVTGGATVASGKVERALARATVELKEANRSMAMLKKHLDELQAKHDVLLEMYGQQAEELAELSASPVREQVLLPVPAQHD